MKSADLPVTLTDLPLFATDEQLAEAIVGKRAAAEWVRDKLPTLASKPGFPPIDEFHGGRPVKLVIRFYDGYLGTGVQPTAPRGVEDISAWKAASKRRG